MIYLIYQLLGTLIFVLFFPFILFLSFFDKGTPGGLAQRFGFQIPAKKKNECFRIWIHAASVGEVQAARLLINELVIRREKCDFFLSTMTNQGLAVARKQISQEVSCFLAPLDVPVNVRQFLNKIEPDIYVCLETELWPAMFTELYKSQISTVILNGRITPRSLGRYSKIQGTMERLLCNLSGVSVITQEDGERFNSLGVPLEAIRITGNIKYDYPVEDIEALRTAQRERLQIIDERVFISGSTRTGEERILSQVYKETQEQLDQKVVWVIAPRHLERLDEVKKELADAELKFELFSNLNSSERNFSIVLVDTMGDLGQLYSAGDVNFVGGSLVNKRGHNIMEAARWGRPVYYGPSIEDFQDAAEILESAGGGFRVMNGGELATLIISHLQNKKVYDEACANALNAVSHQQGAAVKQADMVFDLLTGVPQ